MTFQAFYWAYRELQSSKIKCLRQNAQSARGYISVTVDLRSQPLSASTSEPKKPPSTNFQQNQKWSGVRHWSIYRGTPHFPVSYPERPFQCKLTNQIRKLLGGNAKIEWQKSIKMDRAMHLHRQACCKYRGPLLLWYTIGSGLFCPLKPILWGMAKCFTSHLNRTQRALHWHTTALP